MTRENFSKLSTGDELTINYFNSNAKVITDPVSKNDNVKIQFLSKPWSGLELEIDRHQVKCIN